MGRSPGSATPKSKSGPPVIMTGVVQGAEVRQRDATAPRSYYRNAAGSEDCEYSLVDVSIRWGIESGFRIRGEVYL
jgi:hypothetical protein